MDALGEPDDHLRLAVLLSLAAERHQSRKNGLDREKSKLCRTPDVSWSDRYSALEEVLESAAPSQIAFFDVDALHMGRLAPERRWDDASFTWERERIYRLIVQVGARQGWHFMRTVRSVEVTLDLQDVGVRTKPWEANNDPGEEPAVLDRLAPELRPLARWLLRRSHLTEREMERLLDEVRDYHAETTIMDVVYDMLPGPTREAARRLAQIRQPCSVNGMLGPFSVTERSSSLGAIRSLDLKRLQESGVLQAAGTDRARRLQMPRLVRQYLALRRWSMDPKHAREQSRWLVDQCKENRDPAIAIEAHHHAVLGGDIQQARHTARYYGTDLRKLAFDLSHEKEWRQAAEAYRVIVTDFDSEDAYAWEYLGYNLARDAGRVSEACDETVLEIRKAYERANALDPDNPLYEGRLLGFEAEQGRDVLARFGRGLRKYDVSVGDVGVSFFAKPVLSALQRVESRDVLQKIEREWGRRLASLEELQKLMPHVGTGG